MTARFDDWVTVVPPDGLVKETARVLVDLAEHSSQVRTLGTGNEFLVHPDVASAYERATSQKPKRSRRAKTEEGS